jgi:hypothetical protein
MAINKEMKRDKQVIAAKSAFRVGINISSVRVIDYEETLNGAVHFA